MELVTVHVKPVVRGWLVEAEGSSLPTTLRDSKEDALHTAHAMARRSQPQGNARIVVHDDRGKVESWYPPAPVDTDDG